MNKLLKLKKVYQISKKADRPRLFFRHIVCEAAGLNVGQEVYVRVDEEDQEIILQNKPFNDTEGHSIHVSSSVNKHSGERRPLLDTARDYYNSIISIKEKAEVCVYQKGTLHQVIVRPLRFNIHQKQVMEHRDEKRNDERFKLLSLGAGCGIGTAAFQDTNFFTPVQEIELEEDSAENLMLNYPLSYVFNGDLRDVSEVAKSDVALCTLPCNEYSNLGQGNEDIFNNLILGVVDILRAADPKVIVMENVPGYYKGKGYNDLKNRLKEIWPYWTEKEIESYEFGSSIARRKRTYSYACKDEETFLNLEFPSQSRNPRRKKLKAFLDHKGTEYEWKPLDKWLKSFQSRDSWKDRNLDKTFVKSDTKGPLNCIAKRYTSHSASNSYVLNHEGTHWRFLSISELRRILSIPDWFELSEHIPRWRQYEMIGQSVDCGIIKAIANKVAGTLLNVKEIGKTIVKESKESINHAVTINDNGQVQLVL